MPFKPAVVKHHLREFAFRKLFNELGWDQFNAGLDLSVGQRAFHLDPVAQKRGLQVFECRISAAEEFPDYAIRRKLEREVGKLAFEHLLIFTDAARTRQTWQWVRRDTGGPPRCREHAFFKGQTGDALVQKLQHLAVGLEEEEDLGIADVRARTRQAFDVERITRRFYERFRTEHARFLAVIRGIAGETDRAWYASLMLNRLMFVYFIQKKRFLDDDPDYLRHKLQTVRQERGEDQFITFYRRFLVRLFHNGLGRKEKSRPRGLDKLLGKVPYLNGGLFDVHDLERSNPDIQIPDDAFEKLFDFFDAYQWRLDEQPLRKDNEINPDVLGYIFEKYINQKQMGAYYTKEDITGYIARNTLLPFLLGEARKQCAIAFQPDGAVWKLLRDDPNRYIYPEVRKGVDLRFPLAITAGLAGVNLRAGWNRAADEDFRLPTETWREHVARRRRCLDLRQRLCTGKVVDVNDLVTLNLDIRQFTEDLIEFCEGPDLLRAMYQALTRVSVLDPTCGSGAFLFAALNLLERLYDTCLDRMQAFVDDSNRADEAAGREKFTDFREILRQADAHPNRRYFILKSIIVHNLYGVDIMDEAVEICKLRLFLKLVAQVEKTAQLEPLPDIDFNVRAGNTLVGFAILDDVRKSVELFSQEELRDIQQRASAIDAQFGAFRRMQTEFGPDQLDAAEAKAGLRRDLRDLRHKLDRYLAGVYRVDPDNADAFSRWRISHRPFHWFAEFYGIVNGGGFDVIIGNPPYIQLNEITDYRPINYQCLDCGNLYAVMLERFERLGSAQGRQGVIVPVSSISTDGYRSLQTVLRRRWLWHSSYDDRPSRLFDGLEHIRLAILVSSPVSRGDSVFATRYHKWTAEERGVLFNRITYTPSNPGLVHGSFPKLSSEIEIAIISKLEAQQSQLAQHVRRGGDHVVYYSRKVGYFLQVMDFQPEVRDGQGALRPPSEFKELRFADRVLARLALCCLNSSLFYWFITVFSDCRHLNKREVNSFPIDLLKLRASTNASSLEDRAQRLMSELRQRSERRTMRFKHDTLTVQCIIPKTSKSTIDEIDHFLARHYGFTSEELDFILNYDIKYRMGQDNGAEENE